MNKLVANIICRDSSKGIAECIKSLAPAIDFLNITDTGSVDNTKELIEQTCKELQLPFKLTDFEWCDDFSAARNYNLSQSPATEWWLWIDSDDVVENADKINILLNKCPREYGAIWLPYHYAFDEFGNTTTVFIRERLLRVSVGWTWKNRVHEVVTPITATRFTKNNEVVIIHKHSGSFSRSERNMKLLNMMLKEDPNDKRVWLYFGHQHFADGDMVEAAKWYLKFASEKDTVPIERYQALNYAARALRYIGDFQQALSCDLTCVEMRPDWADGYISMAQDYSGMQDWVKAVIWGEASRSKNIPDEIVFINPLEYTFNTNTVLADAYLKLDNLDKAIEEIKEAINIRPLPILKEHLKDLEKAKRRLTAVKALQILKAMLIEERELIKISEIKEVTPHWLQELPEYSQFNLKAELPIISVPSEQKDGVLIAGTDFETSLQDKYSPIVSCDVIENIATPLPEAIYQLEQHGDKVVVNISHPNNRIRTISMVELEHIVPQPNRRIMQLHKVLDGGIHLEFDHKADKDNKSMSFKMLCGPGLEEWNPDTIETRGIGGSELMAAWLMRELVKSGHSAYITANGNGIWDGVLYRQHISQTPCTVFISSRIPGGVTLNIPSALNILWMHDVHCGPDFTPQIAEKYDAIVVLSKWHLNNILRVHPWLIGAEVKDYSGPGWEITHRDTKYNQPVFGSNDKCNKKPLIAIIPDGIIPERFNMVDNKKFVDRYIWSSAPDRGLKELLDMWPNIRSNWPDAELRIFYGWEYYDKWTVNNEMREFKSKILKLCKQPGVTWVGRVSQSKLAEEFMSSSQWLYPPHPFRETCCITALECQAAMVLCFYRRNGALPETIGKRGIGLSSEDTGDKIINKIKLYKSRGPLYDLEQRQLARDWALQQSCVNMATKWLQLVNHLLEAKQ